MVSIERNKLDEFAKNKRFEKILFYWFLGGAILVFSMIILGGITRITDSGLSMVDWNLFIGVIPPLNSDQWLYLFNEYKKYPEFKLINFDITLNDFKIIYWFEYSHRVLGRFIGLYFIIPFIFFLFKKILNIRDSIYIFILILLGGLQGFLGWYMVKSGLIDNPDVSQYRLAAHYSLALLIYLLLLWKTLSLRTVIKFHSARVHNINLSFIFFIPWLFFVLISGVFVGGTDSGLLYNTYPLMNGEFIPEGFFDLSPILLNFFENKITINFIHRFLTLITIIIVISIWLRLLLTYKKDTLVRHHFLILCVFFQFLIGVVLVINSVPDLYAILHHIGALVLITSAIYSFHGEIYGAKK